MMAFAQRWRDAQIRRRVILWSIGTSIIIVTLAAMAFAALALTSFNHVADRFAGAGAVVGAAAMLLAVIAALVSLLAYALSTGSPDLQLRVIFPFSTANNPSFQADRENDQLRARSFKQTTAQISIRNNSRYSAVNPAIIIRLRGMSFLPIKGLLSEDWVKLEFASTLGIISLQWDGGPKYSIHGESTRMLPALNFERLFRVPRMEPAKFIIEILAEGYRREVTIPVTFKVDGEPGPTDTLNQLPEWI